MRRLGAVLLAAAVLAPAVPARAELALVSMDFASFTPSQLDLLVGDSVSWRNNSVREHDVGSSAAGFDSGRVGQGAIFAHTFDTPGIYPYVCTIHDVMRGQVSVYPLLLSGPGGAVARGAPVALHVRAPEGTQAVTIEEDAGGGFRAVATAIPGAGQGHEDHEGPGTLHATVRPAASASYRAVSAAGASPPLRIEVTDEVSVALAASARAGGSVVRAHAVPAQPRARAVLQLRLRERFGWWTVARARLSSRSRVRFVVRRRRPVRARVLLVGADWATELAASRPIVLRPGPR